MPLPTFTLADAADLADVSRSAGKSVVTTNGTFDLFSAPHLLLLQQAKKQGEVLIVGINSDASVRQIKGDKRPIVPGQQRAHIVSGCKCVDAVFLFDDPDPRNWLKDIRPDVHVNSGEYGEECVEAETLKEIGAKLVLVPRGTSAEYASYISTSDIIGIIRDRYCS